MFNLQIPDEGSLITNQQKSGRCWLFATTNVRCVPWWPNNSILIDDGLSLCCPCQVLRKYVSRKYKLEDFQLSQVSF